jgi:polyisoprenoid-binding protein YceI
MPAEGLKPGTWTIDSLHSFVSFSVEHMGGLAVARGLASGPSGAITVSPDILGSSVTATIDATTLATASKLRDDKIQGPDMLDTEHFPTIEFVSGPPLRETAPDTYDLDGQLTLRGVTRPVTLALRFNGVTTDVWSKTRLGVTAQVTLRRDEFGAGKFGYVPLPLGGIMVPHAVSVTIDIEATKDDDEQ